MHNPFRSYRFLVPGVLSVMLGLARTPASSQTAAVTAQRSETVLTSPVAEVPAGPQGRRYTQTFTAAGGVAPYAETVTGSLPAGMHWTQAENGLLLDGVPSTTGDFPLTVTVTDAAGQRTSHDYVLHVTPYDSGSSINLLITEAVGTLDTTGSAAAIPITLGESVSVGDSVAIAFPVIISVTEVVATSDSVSLPNFVFINVNEAVSTTDVSNFSNALSIAVVEAVSIADVPVTSSALRIVVTEPVSVGDAVTPNPLVIAIMESIGVADLPAVSSALSISVAESVGVTDVTSQTPLQVAQTITVGPLPAPVYGGATFSVSATASSGLPVTITETSGPATGMGNRPYTATGAGTVYFTATQAGNGNYAAAAPVSFSVTIAPASQSITVGALPTPVYGGAAFSVSATASSGLPVTITETSGPATGTGSGPYTATGAGTVNFTATQAGNGNYTAATPASFSVMVGKQASVTVVSASPSSITPVQTTTLTATVSAAVTGSPTGAVTFYDNGLPIGQPVPLSGGQAQLTTLLLSGAQVISATYSGDGNFVASSSTASATVTVAPLDFTMTPSSPVALSVVPGSAAAVTFNVTPLYLVYPGRVTFSVTGLPSSASYTVTPGSISANGGAQTVTVTIQTAAATVKNVTPFGSRYGTVALALSAPLLALGALRRRRRWMSALVLLLGVLAAGAVVGCGANSSGNGFFGQAPQTYPVTITATSGTVQHTINITLQIQ